ncbi:multiple epidermal growth factor-like domains protein 11 [Heptranchias perlo]|uniref:multiple epidermal growth factor-like domains protein 11 n=1 Tax=Heptranchias perlo TaxID=212740 RepID=UPI003559953F
MYSFNGVNKEKLFPVAEWLVTKGDRFKVIGKRARGFYCPNGTIAATQYPCFPGTYGPRKGQSSPDNCTACPRGFFCSFQTGGFGTSNPPQPCKPGFYCPLHTPRFDSYPCPPGTFSPNPGNVDVIDCALCTPGNYCEGGKAAESGPCHPGHHCPLGTKHAEQYGCPNGTFNAFYGKVEESDCLPCIQGHFCGYGSVQPVPCIPGTFMLNGYSRETQKVTGSPAKAGSNCHECTAGYYCQEGSVEPSPCGIGYYSSARYSKCLPCEPGHYCDELVTAAAVMLEMKLCPSGKYCPLGTKSLAEARGCSKGRYCPEGTAMEIPCPPGTLNRSPGKGSLTECSPCPVGYYCSEGSFSETGSCDPGYYCPWNITNIYGEIPAVVGSFGKKQVPCPAGTYQDHYGGSRQDDCLPCTAGSYCTVATAQPVPCPSGHFCPKRTSVPAPCPAGTYSSKAGSRGIELNEFRKCSLQCVCICLDYLHD